MTALSPQKLKMLYLARLFHERTDSRYGLSLADIAAELKNAGVSADRKTLYEDIALLGQFGLDIRKAKVGRTTYYHLASRLFEAEDLSDLRDCVETSGLPAERKNALRGKISRLGSRQMALEMDAADIASLRAARTGKK